MDNPPRSSEALGDGGAFAASVPDFVPRAAQQALAAHIESAIIERQTLIAESGTGTGKTYAYLVPIVLSGRRSVVSTGTKPLQEQLFRRDVPTVLDVLGCHLKTAVLKGRTNYLCRQRLARSRDSGIFDADHAAHMGSISRWAERSKTGDTAEFKELPEDSPIWPTVTSTAENCLGAKCEYLDTCFVYEARKLAHQADLLIVNHHLFCADLVLKEDGFGKLLPDADVVIFDEAHQLPHVASAFLGCSISGSQIRDLLRDVAAEERAEQSQVQGLVDAAVAVERCTQGLCQVLANTTGRVAWAEVKSASAFCSAWDELTGSLSGLCDHLALAAPAGEGLSRCWRRSLELSDLLDRFRDAEASGRVRWIEIGARNFRCHETPLDVGHALAPHLTEPVRAMIFTSATLSVAGRFDFFRQQVGLAEAREVIVDSPFDFAEQGLLYIPPRLPDPRRPEFTDAVVDQSLPVLRASRGRAFMLFTSHRALGQAARRLEQIDEFELLVQGKAPRGVLLTQFRTTENAVLLGTASFWEGVDVRGDALSCVIIDKLPFESPDEPVLRARLRAMEEQGRRPFLDYQLPYAVLALKQGVGRLIRDVSDRGVVMICDPRLVARGYGKVFLKSLPPMRRSQDLAAVLEFFDQDAALC